MLEAFGWSGPNCFVDLKRFGFGPRRQRLSELTFFDQSPSGSEKSTNQGVGQVGCARLAGPTLCFGIRRWPRRGARKDLACFSGRCHENTGFRNG